MGATDFTDLHWGDTAMLTAYQNLCSDATFENGSDPYNGTISTTAGAQQVVDAYMTVAGAGLLARWAFDEYNDPDPFSRPYVPVKWEAALAVPVRTDSAFTFRTASVVVSDAVLSEERRSGARSERDLQWAFQEAALDRAIRKYGSAVHSVSVEVTSKFGHRVVAPSGKPKLAYKVGGDRDPSYHATKSAAMKAAKELTSRSGAPVSVRRVQVFDQNGLTHPPGNPGTEVAVVVSSVGLTPVEARRSAAPDVAFTVVPVVEKTKATVTVVLATPKAKMPADAKGGWFFYGLAAE